MHTEVVQVVWGWAWAIQSTIGARSRASLRVITPPGTSSTSGVGTSAKSCSISKWSRWLSSHKVPVRSAQMTTSTPGMFEKTW